MEDPIINSPSGDQKFPSPQELLEALDQMTDLDEESKKELRESILRGAAQHAGGFQPPVEEAISTNITVEMAMLLTLISLVLLLLVFFGYKLYKSLVDRERRREEKKRQKQQKKKK